MKIRNTFIILMTLFSLGCSEYESIKMEFSKSPYEKYYQSLEKANLLDTKIGKKWLEASQSSFNEAKNIKLPFTDSIHFNPTETNAYGFITELQRGQKISSVLNLSNPDSTTIFIDLFRIEGEELKQVDYANHDHQLSKEIFISGTYFIRVQPELLGEGKCQFSIHTSPTLAFPVAGKDSRAVKSFMGAPRDGGKRKHEGIDIFAKKRNTGNSCFRWHSKKNREQQAGW